MEEVEAGWEPELYGEEELQAVEAHIAKRFGEFPTVLHEIVSPDIHVDICMVAPTDEHPYFSLVTMGMGAHRMDVPDSLRNERLDRAELMICLPPDWEIQSNEERWYWPIRWLKTLARLPGGEGSWLGWGHSLEHGGPFAENTAFDSSILLAPCDFPEEAAVCELPGGEAVNFYQVVPLYPEELAFKLDHDVEALLDRMDGRVLVVDNGRPNFCG